MSAWAHDLLEVVRGLTPLITEMSEQSEQMISLKSAVKAPKKASKAPVRDTKTFLRASEAFLGAPGFAAPRAR